MAFHQLGAEIDAHKHAANGAVFWNVMPHQILLLVHLGGWIAVDVAEAHHWQIR